MNILVIDSSPHPKGNSVRLCDHFVADLAPCHHVDRFNAATLNIKPCTACNACRKNPNTCVIQDDMAGLYPLVRAADLIVLTSPVYWWGVSAQLKLFIDRIYALDMTSYKGKKLAAFAVGEDVETSVQYDLIKGQFREICRFLEMDFATYIAASAETTEDRPIESNTSALEAAQRFAQSL